MNSLEDLVRDTLTERARDVDGLAVAPAPARVRPARRWAAIVTVAMVAAALLVAIVLVAPWRGSSQRNAGPATPPPGTRSVSYHGITLTVPEAWVLRTDPCASEPDAAGIVVIDPPSLAVICSSGPPDPHTQAVVTLRSLQGSTPNGAATTLGGHPARRLDDRGGSYALIEVDTLLSVGAPDPRTVDAVLRSVAYTPVDAKGCAAQEPFLTDTLGYQKAVIELGVVRSGVVCEYKKSSSGSAPYLWGSRTLVDADVTQLREVLASAQPLSPDQFVAGVGSQGVHSGMHLFQLRMADGTGLRVSVDLTGRPVVIYDDHDRLSAISVAGTEVQVPNAYTS